MKQATKVLLKAVSILHRKKFVKGFYSVDEDNVPCPTVISACGFCSVGAISVAGQQLDTDPNAAVRVANDYAQAQMIIGLDRSIMEFNDRESTKKRDVIKLLKDAAEWHEKQPNE